VAPIFGDIEGKLDVFRIECTKGDRKCRYHVDKVIEKYGRKGNMSKWVSELKGDCLSAMRAASATPAKRKPRGSTAQPILSQG
jgi:hypothetical protein